MIYRNVCSNCTAFVRSPDSSRYDSNDDFWKDWNEIADKWGSTHICGRDSGDGVENWLEFERYTDAAQKEQTA